MSFTHIDLKDFLESFAKDNQRLVGIKDTPLDVGRYDWPDPKEAYSFREVLHKDYVEYYLDVPGYSREELEVSLKIDPNFKDVPNPPYVISVNGSTKNEYAKQKKINFTHRIIPLIQIKELNNIQANVFAGVLRVVIKRKEINNDPIYVKIL